MTTNDIWGTEKLPRREMDMIYIVDTSGSMAGAKIGSVNTAIPQTQTELDEISKNNADAEIKIGLLEFSSDAHWMHEGFIDPKSFKWVDLKAGGMTSMGGAFAELNQKLSRSHGWMNAPQGMRAPVLILISDGAPTDNWQHFLSELKKNSWFKAACKIAIAIGDDADKNVLAEFTGGMESVITVQTLDQLKKMIKAVSLTSAMVNSNTAGAGATGAAASNGANPLPDPAKEVVKAVAGGAADDPTLKGVEIGSTPINTAAFDDWD